METKIQKSLSTPNTWEVLEKKPTIFDDLNNPQLQHFKISSLLLLGLAYLYVSSFDQWSSRYAFPIVLGSLAIIEYLIRTLQSTAHRIKPIASSKPETALFLGTSLALSLSLSIWGAHHQMEALQFLAVHLSLSLYILSRTGWLSQGRLGIMVWYDTFQATLRLPFKYFNSGFQVWKRTEKNSNEVNPKQTEQMFQQVGWILGSLLVAGLLVSFVWSQLSQVSESFAALFRNTGQALDGLLQLLFSSINLESFFPRLLLALPIGLYWYGFISGSLLGKKEKKLSYQAVQEKIQPWRVLPNFVAHIIIGSLCLTYALFFLSGLTELGTLLSDGAGGTISPQNASSVAVAGFWQLVRVSLLNFAVLGAFYLLAKKPIWDQKSLRLSTTLLFLSATLLALLAGWKLFGIYILLYGPTPLRLLSGWFVLVLLVWCILTLIRLYKPIQAIRIGLFYALISFTLLCYLYPFIL